MYLRVSAKRHVVMMSTTTYFGSFICEFVSTYRYLGVFDIVAESCFEKKIWRFFLTPKTHG